MADSVTGLSGQSQTAAAMNYTISGVSAASPDMNDADSAAMAEKLLSVYNKGVRNGRLEF